VTRARMMLQGGYMSIIIMKWRLTIRWSRPEIQPDLPIAGLLSE
jgi:hypothetical protein